MAAKRLGQEDWTRALRKIYEVMGESPTETSRGELAETIGEPVRALQSLLAVGREVGIFEHQYVRHPSGQGRASRYRVIVPIDEAIRRLDKFGWDNISSYKGDGVQALRYPRDVVALAAEREAGELRASTGPEAESPFSALRPLKYNESHGLVEAAKQYRERVAFVDAEIERFREKGIRIDRSAFKVARDARLEVISLTLPYVESLEKQVENLTSKVNRVGDVAELRRQLEETQGALRRCQERRKAEVSAEVLAAQERANRE